MEIVKLKKNLIVILDELRYLKGDNYELENYILKGINKNVTQVFKNMDMRVTNYKTYIKQHLLSETEFIEKYKIRITRSYISFLRCRGISHDRLNYPNFRKIEFNEIIQ